MSAFISKCLPSMSHRETRRPRGAAGFVMRRRWLEPDDSLQRPKSAELRQIPHTPWPPALHPNSMDVFAVDSRCLNLWGAAMCQIGGR